MSVGHSISPTFQADSSSAAAPRSTIFFSTTLVALAVVLVLATSIGGSGPLWSLRGELEGKPLWSFVAWHIRLPRVLVAALIGAALGAAGAALQGLFRNPLADPSVLGVSASAALFAQVTIFAGWALTLPFVLPGAATLGAILATLALLRMVGSARAGALELLILGGVAVGQVALALSALLMSLALRDFTIAQRLLAWMLGSLDGRTWMHVLWGVGPILGAIGWLFYRSRELDGLSLGETTAHSLGLDVRRIRLEVVIAAAVLSGIAVAMGGIISFVGLIVPHLTRRALGSGHATLILGSAILGALFLLMCDLLSRLIIAPAELQIGVLTAACGAPWFAFLLKKRFRDAES